MELPDRIENFTKEQMQHLDMLVDQLDEAFPTDRVDEERLAKDPHLAILPSGRKVSTNQVQSFVIYTKEMLNQSPIGMLPACIKEGDGLLIYRSGGMELLNRPHDIVAFNAALNDIGVYVAAPTLKGDDADGDGILSEGAPV